ncbi:hypothetical protein QBC47DRAFT_160853 [Echria macrotheca]|uniref:Extracellular membrane protein CFEM domain-containing protein n=1 Tax=Echria macrotheca TaxID=438768 RepID=A0AAJ0F754_9PEZI|nr:hypothetical protein QBC47DRAFT_160853 [Echria macrotheca]
MLQPRLITAIGTAAALLCLAGHASATNVFLFPDCVDNCVASSGCETESAKCICKPAKPKASFLDDVVTCLYYHCKDELRAVDLTFLNPVRAGCDFAKSPLPKDDVKNAQKLAASFIAKLPPLFPPPPPPPPPFGPPQQTTVQQQTYTKAPPVPTGQPGDSTSADSDTPSPSPSPTLSTSAGNPPPSLPPPTSAAQPPPSGPDSSTPTQDAPGRVPTDSSPFATFNAASSFTGTGRAGWLSLPLIVAMVFR